MRTVIIDPGHGWSTPGKCSPELPDGRRLYEWEFARRVARKMVELAPQYGIKAVVTVPDDRDEGLSKRAAVANTYIRNNREDRCVLVSIHGNAAPGIGWTEARGWEAWTTVGKTNSDTFAEFLYDAASVLLPDGTRLRTDKSDGDRDKEKDFTVIKKANCPAVLTENLFFNNKEDCLYMLSEAGVTAIARLHLYGAQKYFDYVGA